MHERLVATARTHRDTGIAVVLGAILIVQTWSVDLSRTDRALATAIAVGLVPVMALRSRYPLVFIGVLAALAVATSAASSPLLDLEAMGFIVLLACYGAGAHTGGPRAVAGGAMVAVFAVTALLEDPDGVYLGGVLFFGLLFGVPWATGRVVRRRRRNEARLERERDVAHAALADERARIARELHDVVAHAISVIVLQARGGRRLLDSEPEETRGALATIEHTGQQALAEMRRLVGLLREDEAVALAPQPSLARLGSLVDHVRAAGLPVEVSVEGAPVDLPPGVDLSAFRIIQEALTNALKHAGPAEARVLLRYEPEGLGIDITDDDGGATAAAGAGHGLIGIRERVAVYGGRLDAGPRPGGGFAVRAHLPFASAR